MNRELSIIQIEITTRVNVWMNEDEEENREKSMNEWTSVNYCRKCSGLMSD